MIRYILLYVDDLLTISNRMEAINKIKRELASEFEMTDVGKIESYLGIHVSRNDEGVLALSQPHYLKSLLAKFDMEGCKPCATPMEVGLHLPTSDAAEERSDGMEESHLPYRQLIGCLMHATQTTRPDLCASTYYLSRFQNCYTDQHYQQAKRVLRYIQGTKNLQLVYRRNVSSDTDFKSTSGYVFKVFGNTVSWLSRKQSTVSLSSTEAEYIALAEAVCEAKWLRSLLNEMGIECTEPTTIYEDNQSCITIAEEPRKHQRMKHVNIKYNFIRDAIANKDISLKYIPSSDQIADIMTKSLGSNLFLKHRRNLDLMEEAPISN